MHNNEAITKLNKEEDEMFDKTLANAIKTYQSNQRLSVTGQLDADTLAHMMKPRCGVADIINGTNTMQLKRSSFQKGRKSRFGTSLYVTTGSQWPSSEYLLAYQIQTTLVSGTENMRSIVTNVLNKWAQYSPFSFQEVAEGSDLHLVYGFYSGDHGDGHPFDGPGGTLAHSFKPTDGRSHYDASENWSDNPDQNQMDLESVVLHETGHLLGLAHSSDLDAVMYPTIGPGVI